MVGDGILEVIWVVLISRSANFTEFPLMERAVRQQKRQPSVLYSFVSIVRVQMRKIEPWYALHIMLRRKNK